MSVNIKQSVGIVGAGVSGICAAVKLRAAGCREVSVYEKAPDVGGTWRDNRYPGLYCDLPARGYCFSFAPNGASDSLFAEGPNLHRYLRGVAEQFGLLDDIRFECEVVEARWVDKRWELTFADGSTARHDVILLATGYLHHPVLPSIAGMADFEGRSFHSARWPAELDFSEQRVAVIGSGSTGVQIVTALGSDGTNVVQFQRTPSWIMPVPNFRYTRLSRALHQRFPALSRNRHWVYMRLVTLLSRAGSRGGVLRAGMRAFARHGLNRVKDSSLRAALTPDYEIMCKRPVISAKYYDVIQRPNVELVTEPIDRVVAGGIRTTDGQLHEADVIVYATGFDTHAYMRPMRVFGVNGVDLEKCWGTGVSAHRTVMVPGFPNMFLTTGPNSPVATASIVQVAEDQTGFMVRILQRLSLLDACALHPTAAATEEYYRRLRPAAEKTVWATGGCDSWFIERNGNVDLWPWDITEHARQLREPDIDEYELITYTRES